MRPSALAAALLAATVASACGDDGTSRPWPPTTDLAWHAGGDLAMFSSPRPVDLDGDGRLEVVIGHGLAGDDATGAGADGYATARRGSDGVEIWRADAEADLFATPAVADLDGDGLPDVVIAGRGKELRALRGVDGTELWRLEPPEDTAPDGPGHLQFYSPRPVADQDGDGVPDLLVAHGGFPAAGPGEPRPPGHLMIVGGADGGIVAAAELPDGAETYLSPVVYERAGEPTVVFGSGGESLPGSLWAAPLADVLAEDLSGAAELIPPAGGKGMIAPPALADLTADGTPDVVAATFDGRVVAVDGATFATLWSLEVPGSETYTTPAIGWFDDDDVPDLYAILDVGTFPHYERSEHRVVSGADGRVLWSWQDERLAYGSPVAVDLTGDGRDEALVVLMEPDAEPAPREDGEHTDVLGGETSTLVLVDPKARRRHALRTLQGFAPTTPWVGDLDGDGALSLVLGASVFEGFAAGWSLDRRDLGVPAPARVSWGGYMGTDHDGHFRP